MKRLMKIAVGIALGITLSLSATLMVFAEDGNITVHGQIGDSDAIAAYHVTYDANGGTGSYIGEDIASGEADTVLSVEETGITRDGHTFTRWNTEADGNGTSYDPGDSITLNSNVTLYAQWEEETQAGGGTGTDKPSGGADTPGGTTDTSGGTPTGTTDTGTAGSGTTGASSVQTGDAGNNALWLSILGISIVVMTCLFRVHRRNKRSVKERQ